MVKVKTTILLEISRDFLVMTVHGETTNAKEKALLFMQTARCSLAPSIKTKFAGKEFCTMINRVIRSFIMGVGKIT